MASQVLSGANNASYTNNTGQNVRLVINYMGNVTSMTWAGVTTTTDATTIGRTIPNTVVTTTSTEGGATSTSGGTVGSLRGIIDGAGSIRNLPLARARAIRQAQQDTGTRNVQVPRIGEGGVGAAIELAPTTSTTSFTANTTVFIAESNTLPTELMLANTQTFSAVCGAYNIIVIKEDGT